MRSAAFAALILSLSFGAPAHAENSTPVGAEAQPSDARWNELRPMLFKGRTLADGIDVIELHAPARAVEAAVVPVSFHTRFPQTAGHYVKTVSLVVDGNPAPLAAVFHFTPDSGQADVETHLRIDDYTYIHVVAETNDGKFYVSRTFVKAAGGCSAPSDDSEAAPHQLGQMTFHQIGAFRPDHLNLAQLMIYHPNNSGLQMDQVTHLYIPPHYIQKISILLSGKPILTIDSDIALSENPFFRFFYVPRKTGSLQVSVTDNLQKTFTASWPVGPTAAAAKPAPEAETK